jgi:hypothetical protein
VINPLVPDPVSLDLSRRTIYPYSTVHRALAIAANSGVELHVASELLLKASPRTLVTYAQLYVRYRTRVPSGPKRIIFP